MEENKNMVAGAAESIQNESVNKEKNATKQVIMEMAIAAYLQWCEPWDDDKEYANTVEQWTATSMDIVQALEEIVDLDKEWVTQYMYEHGYKLRMGMNEVGWGICRD